MEFEKFSIDIKESLKQMKIEIDSIKCENLYKYMQMLIEWNEKINLTAITDPKDIILKHFIDSLTVSKHIKNGDKILDIGTGAGFPGVPLSILNDNSEFVLVDSLNKRIKFLEVVKQQINIGNILPMHARAEDMAKDFEHREKYDVVVSRAVARLNILLEYMMPFVKIGGLCISMKSINYEDELKEAMKAIEILGGKIEYVDEVRLPNSDIVRNNIVVRKIKNTSEKYPRKPGIPLKKPIV